MTREAVSYTHLDVYKRQEFSRTKTDFGKHIAEPDLTEKLIRERLADRPLSLIHICQKLEEELRELRESEMWQAGAVVRKLRPENN